MVANAISEVKRRQLGDPNQRSEVHLHDVRLDDENIEILKANGHSVDRVYKSTIKTKPPRRCYDTTISW